MSPDPGHDEFARWVHDALSQLYDSVSLQRNPLAGALRFVETSPLQRSQSLRRELLDAIRVLRPGQGVPARSPDWRIYRILELRYIEGLDSDEVMKRVALARAQYFHEQGRALEALIAVLWDRYRKLHDMDAVAPDQEVREDLIRAETDRLHASTVQDAVRVGDLFEELASVVEPLARTQGVRVRMDSHTSLVIPQTSRVLLRQAILGAITCAFGFAGLQSIRVDTFEEERQLGILVLAELAAEAMSAEGLSNSAQEVSVCRQLIAAAEGSVELREGPGFWEARMAWPVAEPCRLLVIDDNEGFVDLFRRYLDGYGWYVIGAVDGAAARALIAEARPTVILLDVLMPKEDGWELLMALKTDRTTADVPIIVCSVINQPRLATALGAAAYLPKPVAQRDLLRVLTPWQRPHALVPPRSEGVEDAS